MLLNNLVLQNFRSYTKAEFNFSPDTTVIIGPNTSGKSNLIESIFLLSTGKSFRAQKDIEMIRFGEQFGRATARILPILPISNTTNSKIEETILEVVLSTGELESKLPSKKFLVNKVPKRRIDFVGCLPTVLFSPLDLELVAGSPSLRRNFLDDVLEQTDTDYRTASISYIKVLRQRNALLEIAREKSVRNEKQFEYWDRLLIGEGQILTAKREAFIQFLNGETKDIFDCVLFYDKSVISKERLIQYKDGELASGVTLVGPHRDDFFIHMFNNTRQTTHDMKLFGSRGQQRLVVLQLKVLQLAFIKKVINDNPVLLLDDIFSELDSGHINLVLEMLKGQQTIMTTTHEEFIPTKIKNDMYMIELKLP